MRCHNDGLGARTKTDDRVTLPARQVQAISRALADPRRFEIFRRIASAPTAACCELKNSFPITAPTLSHHMKELESAGLIEITRCGKFASASLRRDVWQAYLAELKTI